MDNIIEELIRIEGQANEYMSGAEETRREISASARNKLQKFEKSVAAETQESIRRLMEESTNEIQEELENIRREGDDKLRRLESDFSANREAWEEQLFQSTLYGQTAVRA